MFSGPGYAPFAPGTRQQQHPAMPQPQRYTNYGVPQGPTTVTYSHFPQQAQQQQRYQPPYQPQPPPRAPPPHHYHPGVHPPQQQQQHGQHAGQLFVLSTCPACGKFRDAYERTQQQQCDAVAWGTVGDGERAPPLQVVELPAEEGLRRMFAMQHRLSSVPTVRLSTGQTFAAADAFEWLKRFDAPLESACFDGSCSSALAWSVRTEDNTSAGGMSENFAPISYVGVVSESLPAGHELLSYTPRPEAGG